MAFFVQAYLTYFRTSADFRKVKIYESARSCAHATTSVHAYTTPRAFVRHDPKKGDMRVGVPYVHIEICAHKSLAEINNKL